MYQELKDQHGISYASYGLGRVALARHNYDQARRLFEESASIPNLLLTIVVNFLPLILVFGVIFFISRCSFLSSAA